MHETTDIALLNDWQRGFPLCERPFAVIGEAMALDENEVLERYRRLAASGEVSRIGVVFRPNVVGASTLAAMAVPAERIAQVAALVGARREVNHNYEREHHFNLWFVAAAPDSDRLEHVIRGIETDAGQQVLRLPMLEEYHIDLGFDLADGTSPRVAQSRALQARPLGDDEQSLVAALDDGLALEPAPYARLAREAGISERRVLEVVSIWLEEGTVRRIGTVLRHRKLGYRSNAMVVWDVPDALVSDCGLRAAMLPGVTLCYRRSRSMPAWRYNFYCMLHGRERGCVEREIEKVTCAAGLDAYPRQVLFSARCFGQRGPRYARQDIQNGSAAAVEECAHG